jgi:hypothetical protein
VLEELADTIPKSVRALRLSIKGVKMSHSSLECFPMFLTHEITDLDLVLEQNLLGDRGAQKLGEAL